MRASHVRTVRLGVIQGTEPPKPAAAVIIFIAVEKFSALKGIQAKTTHAKVRDLPRRFQKNRGIREYFPLARAEADKMLLNTWFVVSISPCKAPQSTKFHDAPCQKPARTMTRIRLNCCRRFPTLPPPSGKYR
jgi:hypothetical protein